MKDSKLRDKLAILGAMGMDNWMEMFDIDFSVDGENWYPINELILRLKMRGRDVIDD